jgi:hypothetical protein
MSNVLDDQKQQQICALGGLGWTLSRIQHTTGIRRETVSGYLESRGHSGARARPPRESKAKPAISWGKLLGDTAAVTALLDRPASSRARAQMRSAQLAHQGPDRLAHRGDGEVTPSLIVEEATGLLDDPRRSQ